MKPDRNDALRHDERPKGRPEGPPEQRTPPSGRRPGGGRQPPRLSLSNRYSVFVGFMKVLLPATAAALILLVVAWPQFTIEEEGFRLSVSKLAPGQAESLTMLNARFEGLDERDRPYSVTADIATQSENDKDLVMLERPKADITLSDGAWLALTAKSGEFHKEAQVLDLAGSVNLFHDKGFELRTESARVLLDEGIAEGTQPVEGQGSIGTIQAEGFRILDRGARIFFLGRSHLVIKREAQEAVR
jgi:lipopolysaccharide export system protein LptC